MVKILIERIICLCHQKSDSMYKKKEKKARKTVLMIT